MLLRAHGAHFTAGFSTSDRRWYELPPGVRFRHHLDLAIAHLEKAAQVAGQDEPLSHPTERPERRCEVEEVAHDGAASTVFSDVVLVIQSSERAPNNRVPEVDRQAARLRKAEKPPTRGHTISLGRGERKASDPRGPPTPARQARFPAGPLEPPAGGAFHGDGATRA